MTDDWRLAQYLSEAAEAFSLMIEDNKKLSELISEKDDQIDDMTRTIDEQRAQIQELEKGIQV